MRWYGWGIPSGPALPLALTPALSRPAGEGVLLVGRWIRQAVWGLGWRGGFGLGGLYFCEGRFASFAVLGPFSNGPYGVAVPVFLDGGCGTAVSLRGAVVVGGVLLAPPLHTPLPSVAPLSPRKGWWHRPSSPGLSRRGTFAQPTWTSIVDAGRPLIPLCPSDISPASGGNPGFWKAPRWGEGVCWWMMAVLVWWVRCRDAGWFCEVESLFLRRCASLPSRCLGRSRTAPTGGGSGVRGRGCGTAVFLRGAVVVGGVLLAPRLPGPSPRPSPAERERGFVVGRWRFWLGESFWPCLPGIPRCCLAFWASLVRAGLRLRRRGRWGCWPVPTVRVWGSGFGGMREFGFSVV